MTNPWRTGSIAPAALLFCFAASLPSEITQTAQVTPIATIGGDAGDAIYCGATAPDGGAYLAGQARSAAFPKSIGRPPSGKESQILLIKLNSAGDIEYTAFLGGSGDDAAYGIAVDAGGTVHLTGRTNSPDFPVTKMAHQKSAGGGWDSFYLSLKPDGKTISSATYLGGSDEDGGKGIAVDSAGFAYVVGSTLSKDFRATSGKRKGISDAFLAKVDAKTGRCLYVNLLGGTREDYANAVVADASGSLWIGGRTNSDDWRVADNALQKQKHGLWDMFIAKVSMRTGRQEYATYLGGNRAENLSGLALDSRGGLWISGESGSSDFPVTVAATGKHQSSGIADPVLVRLDRGATSMGYGAYLSEKAGTAKAVSVSHGKVVVSGTPSFSVVLDSSTASSSCESSIGNMAVMLPSGVVAAVGRAANGIQITLTKVACEAANR